MEPTHQQSDPDNSTTIDAMPLNPRPDSRTVQNERPDSGEENLDFPSPPSNWKFNIFLGQIEDDITVEEFKKMKNLFTGIIGKAVLQKLESASDLFQVIRNRGFLNNDNLLYLQTILFYLKRHDLVRKCVEHARLINNVIHFTSPPKQPAEGFRFTKFHIEGRDFSNVNKRYIEKLRRTVADILFVPRENVFIAGIEPSSSMLVVLMIPDMYVDILVELLEDNTSLEELVEIGVDIIAVDEKNYNIRGIEEAEIVLSEEQEKLVNVYKQLETRTQQLEERELECLSLQKRLQSVDEGRLASETILATLKKMFHNVVPEEKPNPNYQPATLKSQAALEGFNSVLKFAESTGYEKELILAVLEANTTVVVNRLKESYQLQFNRLRIEVADLQSTLTPLQLELQKYQFVTQVNSGQLDELIFESLANAIEQKLRAEVTISLSVHYLKAMTAISGKLRFKERIKLKEQYQWPKDNPLTETIEKEPNLFLCCIYLKEVEKRATVVDPVPFLTDQLNQVNRKDLASKLQTMSIKSPVSASVSKKKTKAGSSKRGQSPQVQTEKGPKEAQATGSQTELESISRTVDSIQDKVESIYEVLNGIQGKPPPYTSVFADTGMYPQFTGKQFPYGNRIFRESRDTE